MSNPPTPAAKATHSAMQTAWVDICKAMRRLQEDRKAQSVTGHDPHAARRNAARDQLTTALVTLAPSVAPDPLVINQAIRNGAAAALQSLIDAHGIEAVRANTTSPTMSATLRDLVNEKHWRMLEMLYDNDLHQANWTDASHMRRTALKDDSPDGARAWLASETAKGRAKGATSNLSSARLNMICLAGPNISAMLAPEVMADLSGKPDPALSHTLINAGSVTAATPVVKAAAIAILTGLHRTEIFQTRMVEFGVEAKALLEQAKSNHGLLELMRLEPDLLPVLTRDCHGSFFSNPVQE